MVAMKGVLMMRIVLVVVMGLIIVKLENTSTGNSAISQYRSKNPGFKVYKICLSVGRTDLLASKHVKLPLISHSYVVLYFYELCFPVMAQNTVRLKTSTKTWSSSHAISTFSTSLKQLQFVQSAM